jgi:hypothetical protein
MKNRMRDIMQKIVRIYSAGGGGLRTGRAKFPVIMLIAVFTFDGMHKELVTAI